MEAATLFLGLLIAILVLDVAAVVWGVDSRESWPHDR